MLTKKEFLKRMGYKPSWIKNTEDALKYAWHLNALRIACQEQINKMMELLEDRHFEKKKQAAIASVNSGNQPLTNCLACFGAMTHYPQYNYSKCTVCHFTIEYGNISDANISAFFCERAH